MSFVESKTDRTLIVSTMKGPEDRTPTALDYVAWLDAAGWREGYAESLIEAPSGPVQPRNLRGRSPRAKRRGR